MQFPPFNQTSNTEAHFKEQRGKRGQEVQTKILNLLFLLLLIWPESSQHTVRLRKQTWKGRGGKREETNEGIGWWMRRAGRLICDRLFSPPDWGGSLLWAVDASDCTDVIDGMLSNSQHLDLRSGQHRHPTARTGGREYEDMMRWRGHGLGRPGLMTLCSGRDPALSFLPVSADTPHMFFIIHILVPSFQSHRAAAEQTPKHPPSPRRILQVLQGGDPGLLSGLNSLRSSRRSWRGGGLLCSYSVKISVKPRPLHFSWENIYVRYFYQVT